MIVVNMYLLHSQIFVTFNFKSILIIHLILKK
jgi:hypothetical protein